MIDKVNPQALTKLKGFRSRKEDAMTNAERQRKWRRKNGGRSVSYYASPAVGASMLYLKKEWGMETNQQVIDAALRFLTLCTRQGLQRLPQAIDD
jgi:hypothetical protein